MRTPFLFTRRAWLHAAVALWAFFSAHTLHAQALDKPIRLVVPYAPGGPIDVTARALAERVKDSLGVVIIDNKPGAADPYPSPLDYGQTRIPSSAGKIEDMEVLPNLAGVVGQNHVLLSMRLLSDRAVL